MQSNSEKYHYGYDTKLSVLGFKFARLSYTILKYFEPRYEPGNDV